MKFRYKPDPDEVEEHKQAIRDFEGVKAERISVAEAHLLKAEEDYKQKPYPMQEQALRGARQHLARLRDGSLDESIYWDIRDDQIMANVKFEFTQVEYDPLHPPRSHSAWAVSGGLPTLGKRR